MDRRWDANGDRQNKEIMEALAKLFPYGQKIASVYIYNEHDAEDVAQEAAGNVWKSGRRVGSEGELKCLYRKAVKHAAIDLLRKKHGRADKHGCIKNPRPQGMCLDDLDPQLTACAPTLNALRAESDEWYEVVQYEGGDRVAMIFRRAEYGSTDRDIADELGLDVKAVLRALEVAGEIIKRYRREKRGWSA